MLESREAMIADIDETLDQLIANAEVLNQIARENDLEDERLALEKLQESLLSHLVSMDALLEKERPREAPAALLEKFAKLEMINRSSVKHFESKRHRPKVHKRRTLIPQ